MNNMEEKLKKLFEYQKFEHNKKLDEIIYSTRVYVPDEVSDVEIFAVTGGVQNTHEKQEKDEVGKN